MKSLPYILISLLLISCHTEQEIPVAINVALHTDDNRTAPLHVTIENTTRGASDYRWVFEGGDPATSIKSNPGTVVFRTAGRHKITLEAWNAGESEVRTYTVQVDSAAAAAFKAEAKINNLAPADFVITNHSTGGSSYRWTFKGGKPDSYEGQHPPVITYAQQGTYKIELTVNNGSATFVSEQEIEVGATLDAAFTILPSFEDIDDYEVPFRATFETRLQGVASLKWVCEGAEISNATSADAGIYMASAGTYTIHLTASNGKTEKTVSQQVTVKANTNLRTHKNIRLGINTAQESIGAYYSTRLRQAFTSTEINEANGALIDIVFMGLNNTFTYNSFISPDKTGDTPLQNIPNAGYTKFINKLEAGDIHLSAAQFNSMTNDELLKSLPISTTHYGNETFGSTSLPRVVLFETYDGRKGAILVKEMRSNGPTGSYILADIKVQKND